MSEELAGTTTRVDRAFAFIDLSGFTASKWLGERVIRGLEDPVAVVRFTAQG